MVHVSWLPIGHALVSPSSARFRLLWRFECGNLEPWFVQFIGIGGWSMRLVHGDIPTDQSLNGPVSYAKEQYNLREFV